MLAVNYFIPELKPGLIWFFSLWRCTQSFLISGEKVLLDKHKTFLPCEQKW